MRPKIPDINCANNIIEAFDRISAQKIRKNIFISGETDLTYGDFVSSAKKIFSLLRKFDLKPGDRAMISSNDDIIISTLFLAIMRAGITPIIIDPETKDHRFRHLAEMAKPKLIIADSGLLDIWHLNKEARVVSINMKTGFLDILFGQRKLQSNDKNDFRELIEMLDPIEPPASIDFSTDAYVLFTSGTTSSPKGVRITHENLFFHLQTLSRQFAYRNDSKILNILNLAHADGIIQGPVIAMANGATLFRPMQFNIPQIADLIDTIYRDRITHWVAVPTMLSLVYKLCQEQKDAFITDSFKFIISTGSFLEEKLWKNFENYFSVSLINIYGLTETVIAGLFCGPDASSRKIGTVGKAVDCSIKIVDEDLRELPPGEPGELYFKGKNVTPGYFNDPAATNAVINDGWFATGDIASIDEEGFVQIRGRKKEIIISGGINISPEEINEVILLHPNVRESVTLSMPDPVWGEIAVAAICTDESVNEAEIINHCRLNLEANKVPKHIYFFSKLPRGNTGKVKIEEVRKNIIQTAHKISKIDGDETGEKVIKIAAACFNVKTESLKIEYGPDDTVGWDSLSHLELIAALEEEFNIRFSPAEMLKIETLNDALTQVVKKADE